MSAINPKNCTHTNFTLSITIYTRSVKVKARPVGYLDLARGAALQTLKDWPMVLLPAKTGSQARAPFSLGRGLQEAMAAKNRVQEPVFTCRALGHVEPHPTPRSNTILMWVCENRV